MERLRKVKQRKALVPWVVSGLVPGICSVTCQPCGQGCPQPAAGSPRVLAPAWELTGLWG